MEQGGYSPQDKDLNRDLSAQEVEELQHMIRAGYDMIPLELDEYGDWVQPDYPAREDYQSYGTGEHGEGSST